VIEEVIDVPTRSGKMQTFICRPERGGPAPAVFLLMDAPGIRDELYDMGRRLATVGFVVLVPDLYYRAGPANRYGPDVLVEGSDDHKAMRAIRTKMTIPPVMDDVADLIAFVDDRDDVTPGAVGVHGYCMSGPYALAAAARYPDRVKAAASFYGTWLVSDAEESPHESFEQAKGEIYIGCAEHDNLAPLEMVDELRRRFDTSGANGELEMYPAVHHGFAFPLRWCFDQAAAERHWERLISLYRRNLPRD
jgi:carboxymethylenebutenolidase